jgi:hypothetical protein
LAVGAGSVDCALPLMAALYTKCGAVCKYNLRNGRLIPFISIRWTLDTRYAPLWRGLGWYFEHFCGWRRDDAAGPFWQVESVFCIQSIVPLGIFASAKRTAGRFDSGPLIRINKTEEEGVGRLRRRTPISPWDA